MALVVIAYDIPNDRRRARFHALLLEHGTPVQKSVFECDLDDAALRRLKRRIAKRVRPDDNVRIYPLCEACAARISSATGKPLPGPPGVYIA